MCFCVCVVACTLLEYLESVSPVAPKFTNTCGTHLPCPCLVSCRAPLVDGGAFTAMEHFCRLWRQDTSPASQAAVNSCSSSQAGGVNGSAAGVNGSAAPDTDEVQVHADACGTSGQKSRLLVFRGLRVSMGLSCGFKAADAALNKTTGRTHYSGSCAALARGISEAAQVR